MSSSKHAQISDTNETVEDLDCLKVAELKARCKAVSVSMSGCKADLVTSIADSYLQR